MITYISTFSIAVSSINELNSYNIERVISIKGELEQQMRALEAIYGKLCLAYESDNTRAWNYSSQYYQQQQQLMQHFAQQAAVMTTAGPLLSTPHYPQAAQPIIQQQPQTNNSNGTPNKYVEQANSNAIYHPTYYVSDIPNKDIDLFVCLDIDVSSLGSLLHALCIVGPNDVISTESLRQRTVSSPATTFIFVTKRTSSCGNCSLVRAQYDHRGYHR